MIHIVFFTTHYKEIANNNLINQNIPALIYYGIQSVNLWTINIGQS